MVYSWKSGTLKGISIGENATAGTALATLVAQDSNMTEAFFYKLSGSDSSLFNIDHYGRLSLKQAIDYDTTGGTSWWRTADGQWHSPDHRYSVMVKAFNDIGVLQAATTFILTVMDVNEAPVFQTLLQPLWGQNSKGAWNIWASGRDTIFLNLSESDTIAGLHVAKFRAVDPEMGTDVTYDITGADKGYFSIDSNGRLYLRSNLDYEDMTHPTHIYSVVVISGTVNGGAGGMVSELVVISLGNVDDNPTVWKSPVSGRVINQKASIDNISALASPLSIANFAASDGDAGQWVSYYLSGHDSWLFSINSNGLLMLKYDVDYEKIGTVRPNHQIWVMVSAYAPPGGGVKTWGGILANYSS